MKLLKFFIFTFLVTSCANQERNDEDLPTESKIECPRHYVEYCESGRFGEMECICVNRSVLYDQLRNLNGRF
mgnify:CR=1 FL=1